MSLLKDFKATGKDQAMQLLESGASNLKAMQKLYEELFPFPKLSAASNDFKSMATTASNEKVAKAVISTLDQVEEVSEMTRKLEYFIILHIPKIEDGGNFGVGVQLDLVKKLGEILEASSKATEDLLGYQNARAEALGKLSLPSTSTTVTKSAGATTTDGKKEEKTSETTEEKQTSSSLGVSFESRVLAVAAVDTLYYSKARAAFQSCMLNFMSAIDFVDKNKDKLVQPKGSGGSGSSHFSMY
mmetsp:Transcript_6054/g.9470  ORF Transcript_6054/g.9470 Transcript_6054/m.9470 type:complete len:243 (-) Transcript_6054:160-888(-)